jgi:hypothetical protein
MMNCLAYCYGWKAGNLKLGSWVMSLSNELYKTGLGYVWLDREGRFKDVYQIIKIFLNHIQRQAIKKMRDSKSLVLYWNTKQSGGENCVSRPLEYEQENWVRGNVLYCIETCRT